MALWAKYQKKYNQKTSEQWKMQPLNARARCLYQPRGHRHPRRMKADVTTARGMFLVLLQRRPRMNPADQREPPVQTGSQMRSTEASIDMCVPPASKRHRATAPDPPQHPRRSLCWVNLLNDMCKSNSEVPIQPLWLGHQWFLWHRPT